MSLDTQGSTKSNPLKREVKSPLRWMKKHVYDRCGGWYLANIDVSLQDVKRDHYSAKLGAYARDIGDLIGPKAMLGACDCRCSYQACDRHFAECRCNPCETCVKIRHYCGDQFPDIKVRIVGKGSKYCDGCEGPLCQTCHDYLDGTVDWVLDGLCESCRGKVLRVCGSSPGVGSVASVGSMEGGKGVQDPGAQS